MIELGTAYKRNREMLCQSVTRGAISYSTFQAQGGYTSYISGKRIEEKWICEICVEQPNGEERYYAGLSEIVSLQTWKRQN